MEREFMNTVSNCTFLASARGLYFREEETIKLACGHGYCPEDLQELLLQSPVICEICKMPVSQEIILRYKKNDNPEYSTCDKCNKPGEVLIEGACGCHLCNYCYQQSVEEQDQCVNCKAYLIEKEDRILCTSCETPFEISGLLAISCEHLYCRNCIIDVCRPTDSPPLCFICKTAILPILIHTYHPDSVCYTPNCLLTQCQQRPQTCPGCNNDLLSQEVQTYCGCLLCHNCYMQSIEIHEITCYSCGGLIIDIDPLEFIEYRPKKIECQICGDSFSRDEMITLECDHFFCKDCTRQHISTNIADSKSLITCPLCKVEISDHVIEDLVSQKEWDNFVILKINKSFNLVDCPKCENRFIPDEALAVCSCGHSFCVKCLRPPHTGDCDEAEIQELMSKLETAGNVFSQCPQCKSPFIKDDKCEHVKCATCGTEFCFMCSCNRAPTLIHGNHYHRPQCNFYAEYRGEDEEQDDCGECAKRGTLCEQPKNLRVLRRFGEGES